MNKDILDDYKWIRPRSSIWRSNVFSYLPTRIKYGVESVDAKRRQFEKYCKENDILVWKCLPKRQVQIENPIKLITIATFNSQVCHIGCP